jgi:Rad3-related DNA helicase
MSVSQSRYSIIERLTEAKLNIIEEESRLEENIRNQESKIINLEAELKNWVEEVVQENKIEQSRKEAIVQKAKQDLENIKETAKAKKEKVKDKLETIDKALASIEKISETSPAS